MLERSYEGAHCLSGCVDRIMHRRVFILDAKAFWILAMPNRLPRYRVIHSMGYAASSQQERHDKNKF